MTFDQRAPFLIMPIPWQPTDTVNRYTRSDSCVLVFWGDQGQEMGRFVGSQNMLVDGYAFVLA